MNLKPSSYFSPSPQAWRGAAIGVFFATLLLISLSTVDLLKNNVSLGDATLYFVVGSMLTALVGALLVFLLVLFANISALSKWAIACFALIVYYFFIPTQTTLGLILISIWTISSFSLACGSFWSLIAHRKNDQKKGWTLACLLLGLTGIVLIIFWLNFKTSSFSPPNLIESEKKIRASALPNPADQGSFKVYTLNYGHGTDKKRPEYGEKAAIITKTVNGAPFITGWQGLTGWLRTRYWGFDDSEIPLNGLVWFPEGKGPFPLVLIVHGNHEMSAASDSGYAYLARMLASKGFISVSIDQNFLNSGWTDITGNLNEAAARGWLILEHLKLWKQWNRLSDSPFFEKVDMQKIALIGHSRGGEAIATAASFNELDYYPEDGNITFDYHFAIKALAAIAPVDSQYQPGGETTTLNNIDYFVIQGSHDGDVRSFQGTAQYNRIHFHGSNYHFKSSLYVYGANHGQFNSKWGKNDAQPPINLLFNLNQFLPEEEQRQIAKVYIAAFIEAALQDKKEYLPLFHNWHFGKKWLPKTLYFNNFSDSNEFFIIKEKSSIDLGKTILAGGTAKGEHLTVWRRKQIVLREGNPVQAAIVLGWMPPIENEIPSYTIYLPPDKISINQDSTLVLSLGNSSNHSEKEEQEAKENGNKGPINFTIELTDSFGNKAALPLSHYAFLQPAIHLHLMKSDFLDPLETSETAFQTFEFPLKDFLIDNPNFNLPSLEKIRFLFNKSPKGLIVLDSLSIRNGQGI